MSVVGGSLRRAIGIPDAKRWDQDRDREQRGDVEGPKRSARDEEGQADCAPEADQKRDEVQARSHG